MLFLVTQSKAGGRDVPDLVQALPYLVCSLELTLHASATSGAPSLADLCQQAQVDPKRVEQLREGVFATMIDGLKRHGFLQMEESSGGVLLLAPKGLDANIGRLHSLYVETDRSIFSFDDSLLLDEAPPTAGVEQTPARKVSSSKDYYEPTAPGSPYSSMARSLDAVKALLDKRPNALEDVAQLPSPLKTYFDLGGADGPIVEKIATLVRSLKRSFTALGLDEVETARRFSYVSKLYYFLLERLLEAEMQRLGHPQAEEGFQILLRNEKFHRSLLWCALETVLYTYRTASNPRLIFPSNLELLGVTPLDLLKVIESVVRQLRVTLNESEMRRLVQVEQQLLEEHVWRSTYADVWDYLRKSGVREALYDWIKPGEPQSATAAMIAPSPMAPKFRGGAHMSALGPPTPVKDGPILSYGVKLLLKKGLALCAQNAKQLCDELGMHSILLAQVMKTISYCLAKTELCRDRHLDTILLCSVFAVAKGYHESLIRRVEVASTFPVGQEIKFREILSQYNRMVADASEKKMVVHGRILLSEGKSEYGDIIAFYNQCFIPEMSNFVCEFQQEFQSLSSTLVNIRPGGDQEPAALSVPHPVLSQIGSHRNVSVSPLKSNRGAPSPRPAVRVARLGPGQSPAKDLAAINESVNSKQPANPRKLFKDEPTKNSSSSKSSAKKRSQSQEEDDDFGDDVGMSQILAVVEEERSHSEASEVPSAGTQPEEQPPKKKK